MNRELETDGITVTPATDIELAAADRRKQVSMWQKEVTKLRRELRQATAVVADQERINNELFDEKNRAVAERDALQARVDELTKALQDSDDPAQDLHVTLRCLAKLLEEQGFDEPAWIRWLGEQADVIEKALGEQAE